MKRLKVYLFVGMVTAMLFALLLVPAVTQAQGTWTAVPSPSTNELHAVTSISANDVWAVGVGPITEHWNGSAWSIVSSPTVANGKLLGVAAASTNDVWAVGDFNNASGVRQTLIEQWNGKKWSVVPSPNVGTQPNELLGVTAVSANDIWAVGDVETVPSANFFQTLTLHWDGTTWSIVPSPSPSNDTLRAVAAVSTSDVWAVGDSGSGTLIEQWNGSSWSVVTSPNPSTITNVFNGVAIVSATEIWAVGDFIDNNTGAFQTLIELWNGTSWSIVSSPNPAGMQDFFDAASADPSSGQAWAVGSFIAFNP